ncbi:hypothetical protein D0Z00_001630 [Geotrichum galactomycetum]|uniref:Uncharacterized protein n=1 Tax=Geotrichum galactomycetum TaxID=27317 RepID=A0ACB6V6E1_9ASCO|nr:hypothetical protein D0Z00_001630 [Geotrichum candidum]
MGEVEIDLETIFTGNVYSNAKSAYKITNVNSQDQADLGSLFLSFTLVADDAAKVDVAEQWKSFLEFNKNSSASGFLTDGADFDDSDEINPANYDKLAEELGQASLGNSDVSDVSGDEADYASDSVPVKAVPVVNSVNGLLAVPVVEKNPKKRSSKSKGDDAETIPSGYFEFNAKSQVVGLAYIEIVNATDLPPQKNMTRTGFDMDPFVVASFGKKTFRTHHIRHNLNPVFNEKIVFPVLQHEQKYSINFTVMDKDKLSLHDLVGSVDFEIQNLLSKAPQPDPKTLLYDLAALGYKTPKFKLEDEADTTVPASGAAPSSVSNEDQFMLPFELPLTLNSTKYSNKSKLSIKCRFLPYGALRQQFWRGLIKIFDTDNSGTMNFFEISELLEAVGSTITETTVLSYFSRFNKEVGKEDLSIDELVICLEDQVLKDTIEQQTDGENNSGVNRHNSDATDFIRGLDTGAPERVFHLSACPLCNQPRMDKRAELDIITHLATCSSQEWATAADGDGTVSATVLNSFVTSKQAGKRWFSKVVSKVTYGNYELGANSANILVQDRITGLIQEEKMSTYVRLGIRILYQGIRSQKNMESKNAKSLLKSLSVRQGEKYDSLESAAGIPAFIKFHGLNMEEVLEPLENFKTFNEFFYRKLKPEARPVDAPSDDSVITSAADSRSTYFPTISKATEIWIKGREFSISRLFGDAYAEHVDKFENGSLCIFRLAPQDYHRFHVPVAGVLGEPRTIEGDYYTVNPMAIRSTLDVYGENVRVLVPIQTKQLGLVMVVCVGAMMVGSTVITAETGAVVRKGDELGYFQFGGSTLVVLFEPGRINFDKDLVANSEEALETLVRVGMQVATAV